MSMDLERVHSQPIHDAGEPVSAPDPAVESRLADVFSSLDGQTVQSSAGSSVVTEELIRWLTEETHCSPEAARQALEYVAAEDAAIGMVPTQSQVVFERFFDESGGMQLVVHAPFGGRINRAWGLAMRKRFCRSFDFELQATADDDGFILSLGPQHSFPIESLFTMLRPDNCRTLLEQALLTVPMFHLRWRWNATRALQIDRQRNGKKVPPALQRFRSEDLLTAVFPKLTGCQEEHTGDHEIPDHPLIQQTMYDCLHEALDLDGLLEILARIEQGEITLVGRDTREPSPFAYELLNANPYAFLDGGEIQERRARMATTRRSLTIESVRDLGRLDPLAIEQVVLETQPVVRDADELHDVLLSRIFLPVVVGEPGDWEETSELHRLASARPSWRDAFTELVREGRATLVNVSSKLQGWVAVERLPVVQAIFPHAECTSQVSVPEALQACWSDIDARQTLLRGLLEMSGPVTPQEVARLFSSVLSVEQIAAGLEGLEGEGIVLRGHFRPDLPFPAGNSSPDEQADTALNRESASYCHPRTVSTTEWCHRRLLSRIHRLTVAGLRREIEPVDITRYLVFLCEHHGVTGDSRREGVNGLHEVLSQLQGLDLPAVSWERDILPVRLRGYRREWLDELCLTGEVGWGRLYPPARDPERSRPVASITRLAPVSLYLREDLSWLRLAERPAELETLSSPAIEVLELLQSRGAMFATDLMRELRLLPTHLDETLGELVTRGWLTSDGFAGLRALIRESGAERDSSARQRKAQTPRLVRYRRSTRNVGRWALWRGQNEGEESGSGVPRRTDLVEQWAWQLLRRWGVVFKDLLQREAGAPAWWELVQVYRRLEARGEIRGGRFIQGVAGEQFAVGESVARLRRLRDETRLSAVIPQQGQELTQAMLNSLVAKCVILSACDPLNLAGIVTPGPRVPATAANRVVLLYGEYVAACEGGTWRFDTRLPEALRQAIASPAVDSTNPSMLSPSEASPYPVHP